MMRRAKRTRTVAVDLSEVESNRSEQFKSMPLRSVLSELKHSVRAYISVKFENKSAEERERLARIALDCILRLNDNSYSSEHGAIAVDFVVEDHRNTNPGNGQCVSEGSKPPSIVAKMVQILETKNETAGSGLSNKIRTLVGISLNAAHNKPQEKREERKPGTTAPCQVSKCKSYAVHKAPALLEKESSGIIAERTNDFLSVLRFFENK